MTDDELVKRLRERIDYNYYNRDGEDAADAIKRLTRERDAARAGNYSANEHEPTWAELADYWKHCAEAAERKVEKLREALKAMLREHDILSENDPSVRRGTDRWPTSAGLARAAIAETENTNQYHLLKGVSIND